MRWIVLALSLGTGIMSLIHGVLVRMLPSVGAVQAGSSANFTWLTFALLGVSFFFALIGGVMAFNRRRSGGILLLIASVICFFIHREIWPYGGSYFAGGILAFFCRKSSHYEDGEDEEFDEDDYPDGDGDREEGDEEYEDEFDEDSAESDLKQKRIKNAKNIRAFPSEKRPRERTLRIRENRETYNLGKENLSKLNDPVRLRSSKVCPVCGASVGIEHKFCYSCGTALHTVHPAETGRHSDGAPSTAVQSADSPPPADFADGGENFRPESSSDAYSEPRGAGGKHFADGKLGEDGNLGEKESREEELNEEEFDEEEPYEEEFDGDDDVSGKGRFVPQNAHGRVEITSPNKIFVKPASDENVIPKRPISINPDNSYQAFSNYTRRRKHRRYSLLRRILGMFFLAAAVGGAAWFLLGLRTVPEVDLSAPSAPVTQNPSDDIAVIDEDSTTPDNILAMLRIDTPSRGVVTGANVNVRPNHSTAGAVVTKLNQGDQAEVIGQWRGVSGTLSGVWYQIRLTGRQGWIYGQYFQPIDSRPTTLPPGYTALLLKAFGSDRAELISRQGQPTRQTAASLTWQGLTASLRDEEVTRFQVTNAKYVFQNGIAVGITDEMLYQNMGYPSEYRSGQLLYLEAPNQGVSVQMRNGKIQSITVGSI